MLNLRGIHMIPSNFICILLLGTHFVWEMLNRLNIDVHHEGVGGQGAVSWLYAVK